MKTYGAYRFRSKDPVIDETRTLVEDHFGERVRSKHLRQIERDGGPSVTAMSNWFFGRTLKPQSASVEACGRAIGWKRTWVRMDGKGK
jgi:hypothetical protein